MVLVVVLVDCCVVWGGGGEKERTEGLKSKESDLSVGSVG